MTQSEAIGAFLKALGDLVESTIYQHASDYHSYYSEMADARMRIADALCVLLSGKVE